MIHGVCMKIEMFYVPPEQCHCGGVEFGPPVIYHQAGGIFTYADCVKCQKHHGAGFRFEVVPPPQWKCLPGHHDGPPSPYDEKHLNSLIYQDGTRGSKP